MNYPELLRTALDTRMTVAKSLSLLRASGASPAEAADAVRAVTGCAYPDARRMVDASRAWSAPRSGTSLRGPAHDWPGAIGQHGRSGHGASSVLPHLVRQAQAGAGRPRQR